MKKVVLYVILLATACQVNVMGQTPRTVEEVAGDVAGTAAISFLMSMATLYLKRAGVDIGGQLYRHFKKPTTALEKTQIKRKEERIRKILALSPLMIVGAVMLGELKSSSAKKEKLLELIGGLVGASLFSVPDFKAAHKRQKVAEEHIALLEKAASVA